MSKEKEEKNEDFVEENEPIKIGTKEWFIIFAVIALIVVVFNSSEVKDKLFDRFHDDEVELYSYDEYEYDDDEYEEEYDDQIIGSTEVLDCIDVTISRIDDNEAGIVLKNTSSKSYSDLDLSIVFYDGDKKIVGVEKEYIGFVSAEGKWADTIYNVPAVYETYEWFVTARNYDVAEQEKLYNSISITQVFGADTNMSVRFTNNYDKKIGASVTALYYDKAGRVCDMERFYVFDLKKNKSEDVESYRYLDFQKTENSGVEIILTSAYEE